MEANLQGNVIAGRKFGRPIRVLVVEDEWLIGEWVAAALTEQGFTVRSVANAADALRRLAAEPMDVLFTDINLGDGMDGAALASRARELWPQITVVYASARAALLPQEARVPGALIVPKPYEPTLIGLSLAGALSPAPLPT